MWKILNLQHASIPVVKCVNKIRQEDYSEDNSVNIVDC